MKKKIEVKAGKKCKTPTTNYPKDTHNQFCDRCYKFNRHCPATGTKRKSFACNL